jgi:hypothetical protein
MREFLTKRHGKWIPVIFVLVLLSAVQISLADEKAPLALIVYERWEGEIDPREFAGWEIEDIDLCPQGLNDRHILVRNPVQSIEPYMVELVVFPSPDGTGMVLKQYRYFKDDIEYKFIANDYPELRYVQTQPRES